MNQEKKIALKDLEQEIGRLEQDVASLKNHLDVVLSTTWHEFDFSSSLMSWLVAIKAESCALFANTSTGWRPCYDNFFKTLGRNYQEKNPQRFDAQLPMVAWLHASREAQFDFRKKLLALPFVFGDQVAGMVMVSIPSMEKNDYLFLCEQSRLFLLELRLALQTSQAGSEWEKAV